MANKYISRERKAKKIATALSPSLHTHTFSQPNIQLQARFLLGNKSPPEHPKAKHFRLCFHLKFHEGIRKQPLLIAHPPPTPFIQKPTTPKECNAHRGEKGICAGAHVRVGRKNASFAWHTTCFYGGCDNEPEREKRCCCVYILASGSSQASRCHLSGPRHSHHADRCATHRKHAATHRHSPVWLVGNRLRAACYSCRSFICDDTLTHHHSTPISFVHCANGAKT